MKGSSCLVGQDEKVPEESSCGCVPTVASSNISFLHIALHVIKQKRLQDMKLIASYHDQHESGDGFSSDE
jgi:hypothetical protein